MTDRAIVFIDGNNWYHSLRAIELPAPANLSYAQVSMKLLGPRQWCGTRYYIGQVSQRGNSDLYRDQRRFLSALQAEDRRMSVHFGRLETRTQENEAAKELKSYLDGMAGKIENEIFQSLLQIADKHRVTEIVKEKASDVFLAVDLVAMAMRNEYDAAYILSADGDYTPAVAVIRSLGKKVYAASPSSGAALASAVNTFIRLERSWFFDCFKY